MLQDSAGEAGDYDDACKGREQRGVGGVQGFGQGDSGAFGVLLVGFFGRGEVCQDLV